MESLTTVDIFVIARDIAANKGARSLYVFDPAHLEIICWMIEVPVVKASGRKPY